MGIEDSEASSNQGNSQNQQEVGSNPGQAINQMIGGMAMKIDRLTIFYSQKPTGSEDSKTVSKELGANPYRGLLPFRETDGDRFFGREVQIEQLWQKFCDLHTDESTVRVLPIYGPSGSGKSSLARAGLIPALGKRTLPGRDRSRLGVLLPGTHPLEALATVLARIATNDSTPVEKSQEFERVLKTKSDKGKYEGLRYIADRLPDIDSSPLIILVDQFEEVYTYALLPDKTERDAFIAERDTFIENLLCAAAERSQRVSVIITMRSDFLGKTQQHPRLNKLFSSQGFLVPIMQPEELAIAINEPAKQKGYELDKATVQLLVEQSKGQEGALPLLQFALTQIWEELRKGIKPADTLEQIGGVGGALANEAKRLYESLNTEKQKIARSIFLALIQLNDDRTPTRRRARISELITSEQDAPLVREVIDRFARPGVWILVTFSVTFSNEQQVEMVEVAHEALIRKWPELQEWLKEHWENLRKKRKIEQDALDWQKYQKSKDYLLQGRSLRDAREFLQAQKENTETSLSGFAKEFVKISSAERRNSYLANTGFLIIPILAVLIPLHFWLINKANLVLYNEERCKPNPEAKFLTEYMVRLGYKEQLRGADLCYETLSNIYLKGANLSDAKLQNSNLSGANLQETSLEDADLSEAYLAGADLTYAYLSGTILKRARLENANLMGVTLIGNQLENAYIRGANMRGSHILNVNFLNANLSNVDLTEATIEEPINLSPEQISQAKLCRTTILPEDPRIKLDKDCKK